LSIGISHHVSAEDTEAAMAMEAGLMGVKAIVVMAVAVETAVTAQE
jgi:hypothetical protein